MTLELIDGVTQLDFYSPGQINISIWTFFGTSDHQSLEVCIKILNQFINWYRSFFVYNVNNFSNFNTNQFLHHFSASFHCFMHFKCNHNPSWAIKIRPTDNSLFLLSVNRHTIILVLHFVCILFFISHFALLYEDVSTL